MIINITTKAVQERQTNQTIKQSTNLSVLIFLKKKYLK